MRIALFGTSADPPTAGHQIILEWLSCHFDLVAAWAAENPFKSHQAALSHRVAMLELVIEDISFPRHNIYLEQDLSSLRSLETLDRAKQRWGNQVSYTLVVGSDLLQQLPRWYRSQDLLQQVELLVVPRPGYIIDEASLSGVKHLGAKIAIASLIGLDVSSTAYREHGDLQALIPSVANYIQQQHLYKCQDESSKERIHTC
ncbi:nicotinate-nucleotide adenylyltransferase [Calothrix sp. PCC 6303]|uniref:nicotinate-nucleotide adenylyltransferase n=1 Tax=Calothrix sp. PCC 6303 TaxID=1170562 RepID=UPI0002A04E56|nr:nicotinate-nucleotide adenylyltransferase [Calothrix sp. PCC 6303]AFZ03909.1 nicotinate-nucleotide adenylyltransferase [Calothrix sp. PCC 6303]